MDKWKSLSTTQKAAIVGVVLVALIGTIVTITILSTRNVGDGRVYTKTEKSTEMARNLNRDVDPCVNFYEFACGNFKKYHPYDEMGGIGSGYFEMQGRDINQAVTKLLLANLSMSEQTAPEAYLREFFKKCNETLVENDEFDKLRDKIKDIFEGGEDNIFKIMARINKQGLPSLVSLTIGVDPFDTAKHVIMLGPPAARSPLMQKVFDSFTKKRTTLKEQDTQRQAAITFIAESIQLLEEAEGGDEKFRKDANETIEFINHLATLQTHGDSPQLKDMFNKKAIKELDALDKSFNWTTFLQMVVGDKVTIKETDTIIVGDVKYITQVPEILKVNSSKVINFMKWAVVQSHGFYTGYKFREIAFKFEKTVSGDSSNMHKDIWVNHQCGVVISERASEVLGRMYVKAHITEQDKLDGQYLVNNITQTFNNLIQKKDWMDEKTRAKALKKLLAIKANVGYPDWLLDDEKLEKEYHFLSKGNLSESATLFDLAVYFHESTMTDSFESLDKPVDRDHEWPLSPIIINAAYYILQNTITIPASLLRGIFFSKDYPEYINYGQLGSVIGHELTHAFDVRGSQSDENGNLVDWWTKETHDKFMEKAQCLVQQYNEAKLILGDTPMHLNGTRTLSENIADNGGVREAFKAWQEQRKLTGKVEEPLDGLDMFSEEQLFFLAYANNWCVDEHPVKRMIQFISDVHSPSDLRVNFVLANFDQFSKAYSCPENTPMNPPGKCKVW